MRKRKFLSSLFEEKNFTTFFLYHFLSQYRINRLVKNFASRSFIKIAEYSQLSKDKSNDVIFVLGSGSSVNELGDRVWEEIRSADSIGINFWLIHDHVPDYYLFEVPRDEDRKIVFRKLLESKKEEYLGQKCTFLVKDISHGNFGEEVIPQNLRENVYTFFQYNVLGSSLDLVRKSINRYRFFGVIKSDSVLLSRRATVFSAVYFAWKMGYKKIVLVGVDLNNTRYFYEDDEYKGALVPSSGQTGEVHKTVDPQYGSVKIDELICAFNEDVLKPEGVKLYTASKKSLLYPRIPFYR